MSYLQFGVPLSTEDMQKILDLLDHAEDSGFKDGEFLERMKVLFSCAFNTAQAKRADFLSASPQLFEYPTLPDTEEFLLGNDPTLGHENP